MSYSISCKSFCILILTFPFFPTYCTPKFLYCLSFLFFFSFFTSFTNFFFSPVFPSSLICFPFSCHLFLLYNCLPGLKTFFDASCPHLCQIAREAEAAMFHRQVFEDLRRSTPHCKDPAEAIAIGAVEASFKSLASAIIVLTGSGR